MNNYPRRRSLGQRLTEFAILVGGTLVAFVCAVLMDRDARKAGQR